MKHEGPPQPDMSSKEEKDELSRKMQLGMIQWKDGQLIELTDEELAEKNAEKTRENEPSIEIDPGYQAQAEQREKETTGKIEEGIDSKISSSNNNLAGSMKALEDTRTLESYKNSVDVQVMKGNEVIMYGNDNDWEEARVKSAINLNNRIKEIEEGLQAAGIAKEYYGAVRQALESQGSEDSAVTKTLETMEAEEIELAGKIASKEATDDDVARLARLADAKKLLKDINKR